MKFLRAVVIVALSVFGMQTVSALKPDQQAVRARREDGAGVEESKKEKVTIKITSEDGKTLIRESTFTDNTDRFAKKLWFDWEKTKGLNKITAFYKNKPSEKFSIIVSRQEAPPGSEIVVGKELRGKGTAVNILKIDISKATEKTPEPLAKEPIEAVVDTWAASKSSLGYSWYLISGTNGLTSAIVEKYSKSSKSEPQVEVLDSGRFPGGRHSKETLKIYPDKVTRIYAERGDNNKGKMTALLLKDIKAAGPQPVITIDDEGNVRIVNRKKHEFSRLFDDLMKQKR